MNLIRLAEDGDTDGVLRELGTMTPAQRAGCAEALAARAEAMAAARDAYTGEQRDAQRVAELGCQVSPEAAAGWLLRNQPRHPTYDRYPGYDPLAAVAGLYPPDWRAELVARLAAAQDGRHYWFPLAEHIVRDIGGPLPATDAFVSAWLAERSHRELLPAGVLGGAPGGTLLERLRNDDLTPRLLPLAVTRPGVRLDMTGFHYIKQTRGLPHVLENFHLGVFISLCAEGAADREALISRIFADLIDAPQSPEDAADVLAALALTPAEHARVAEDRVRLVERLLETARRNFMGREAGPAIGLLRALAPTTAENARFAEEYLALLAAGSHKWWGAPVIGYAQEALLGADEAGLLAAETFAEMSERVLLRPEKKLVRAQLAGLDRAARRDTERAARVVADAATAFQHPEPALQERALDVIARHLPAAGDAVLPELRAAAAWLSPAFSVRAVELLGAPPDTAERFSDVLPAVPGPRPVPGPAATAAEVAQEIAAVIAGDQEVAAFERALDGLVRHARSDRAALAKALRPATRRKPAEVFDCCPADIYDVAMAVRGEQPRPDAFNVHPHRPKSFSPAGAMLAARLSEAIDIIESGPQPFLLAVPTMSTGALDAGVLAERLSALEKLGVEPAPVDLAQALLRVAPAGDARTLPAAGELCSGAGQRLARWLREGGLPHQDSEPEGWYRSGSPDRLEPARPGTALDSSFPPVAAALIGPYHPKGLLMDPPAPFWVAQLPHHRDEMMARGYTTGSVLGGRRRTRVLPFVAEADGPAGYAVHLALARGLANGPHGDDATVDALLVLAARGQLDTGLLGWQLETLVRTSIPANRVVAALRAVAETGAYGTAWAVIEAALPGLLRDAPVRGAESFLSLAVECVSRCGAKGEIAEVVAVAERGGSSQTVKNARLLRDALR